MRDAAELCTDCGICCDGTLFSSVSLDDASIVAARHHHLPLLSTADATKLEHPCAALRGVLCEIYDDRPEQCADYECELLLQVDDDQLTFRQARAVIEKTRALGARVRESIGTTPWWVALRSPDERSPHAAVLADLQKLEALVKDHFWG